MRNILRRLRWPVYVVDAWTLHDFYRELVKSPCEEIFYVTGVELGNVRVLSRMCALEYEKQSPVYVSATRKSSVDALIEMADHENRLHLVAHSHPGIGAFSTLPSGTDLAYLGKLQKAGAEAIALIVSRNGFLRFWTVSLPFKIVIRGNGISEVKGHENVFRLEIPKTNREQSREASRPALLSL